MIHRTLQYARHVSLCASLLAGLAAIGQPAMRPAGPKTRPSTTPAGRPVSGAEVVLSSYDRPGPARPPSTLSDAAGRFVFHGVPSGMYRVTASKPATSGSVSSPAAPGASPKTSNVVNAPPPQPGDPADHPEWGAGTGATVGMVTLAPITVAGQSTVDFSFASVMNELPLPLPFVSIRIQYSGAAGSMVAELASVDQRQDLVVDSKLMNEGWGWSGSGANPWHLDKQTESVLFLTNESGQSARIAFAVTANGVHYYLTELKLQPHETRAIDLRKLREAQVPDLKQHVIPATAADGAVNWVRIDNVPVEGRLVVVQRSGGVASNYDCCTCICPVVLLSYGAYINPLTGFIGVGGLGTFGFTALFQNCNYVQYPYNETSVASWSSGNTGVMTMDPTQKGEAHGISSGVAGNSAQVSECGNYYSQYGQCTCTGQNQANGGGQGAVGASVQVSGITAAPNSVSVSSGTKSTVTVTVYHFGTNNVQGANATVEISDFTSSPGGNDLSGLPASTPKSVQAPDGNTAFTFQVNASSGLTKYPGYVEILGAITAHSPGNINVVAAPNPPKEGVNLVKITTTN